MGGQETLIAKDVFNGDIGQIVKIDPDDRAVTIRFDQREVVYDYGELDEVSLAYSITIHKSQGSEFPSVVIPFSALVDTDFLLFSVRKSEVRRCCPSRISLAGTVPVGTTSPSRGLTLNRTPLLPIPRSMTAPTGYDIKTPVINDRIWFSF